VAEWAKGALAGMAKGAPFSLSLTKLHFATVALAANNAVPAASPENNISEVRGSELPMILYCLLVQHSGVENLGLCTVRHGDSTNYSN